MILKAYRNDKLSFLPSAKNLKLSPELTVFYENKITGYKNKNPVNKEVSKEIDALVYEKTGEPAPEGTKKGTKGYITQHCYYQRHRLVNEETGEPAPGGTVPGSKGYITQKNYYQRHRLVHEETGEPAPEGTKKGSQGYITQHCYYQRHRLVHEETGEPAPQGTKKGTQGYITQNNYYQRHRLADSNLTIDKELLLGKRTKDMNDDNVNNLPPKRSKHDNQSFFFSQQVITHTPANIIDIEEYSEESRQFNF
ncbi:hypothetical protein [uncultured Legionella sp.]|uniref:hypothetical protein n=1 Tax=uncultured Legionella sp. TaxID=210934 RepID=UPI002637A0F1|nr:hypothetical protein [uncultured Legionella sp.]